MTAHAARPAPPEPPAHPLKQSSTPSPTQSLPLSPGSGPGTAPVRSLGALRRPVPPDDAPKDPDWDWATFWHLADQRDIGAYLYGNEGPWPQPAPALPTALMPEVIHLPPGEQAEWKRKVSRAYLKEMLTCWLPGLFYIWRHPHQVEIDDEAFSRQMGQGLYSKFLTDLDPPDLETFGPVIRGAPEGTAWLKIEGRHMARLQGKTRRGVHVAPTLTLLRVDDPQRPPRAVAICLTDNHLLLTPDDADRHAWNLARYFALQGAAHRINLIDHPLMHFPFDSINAVTKTLLPRNHWLLQLLLPHLYLSLGVNHAVLEGNASIVNRTKWTIYSPFAAMGAAVRSLLTYAYLGGKPGEQDIGYPRYRFQFKPPEPRSAYQAFVAAYHPVVLDFVRKVVRARLHSGIVGNSAELLQIRWWADAIAQWLPGFPDGRTLIDQDAESGFDTLAQTVAMIIWTLSVVHSTDHQTLHDMPPDSVPFRIRVPPPKDAHGQGFRQRDLNNRWDLFQAWLASQIFYKPHNQMGLRSVDYAFEDDDLQALAAQFRQALDTLDRNLHEQGAMHLFARLDQMSTSVQY